MVLVLMMVAGCAEVATERDRRPILPIHRTTPGSIHATGVVMEAVTECRGRSVPVRILPVRFHLGCRKRSSQSTTRGATQKGAW